MAPTGNDESKGMLNVKRVILIERLIEQLIESEVNDITILTGFQKERYEYLKEKYNVKLVYNSEYLVKNNAYTLSLVRDKIKNTYIVPCDIYMIENVLKIKKFNLGMQVL